MLRLVRAVGAHAEVIGLRLRELGQHNANFIEMQPGDFFIKLLRQPIDRLLVFVLVRPEVQLRERLVGERVGHDERWMAGGATEVHEAAFGQQIDALVTGQIIAVVLRLDVLDAHALDFLFLGKRSARAAR